MKDNRRRHERIEAEAENLDLRLSTPEEDISASNVKDRSWKAEDVLQGVLERIDPQGEHAKDVAAIRKSLDDNGSISNVGGARRRIGMSGKGTMRFAGSIPAELWHADQMLHPYLGVKERARKLLKEFPQFRTGNI